MKLKIGFSPCPNDTFIFDALVNGRIDTQGLDFDFIIEDVEQLNQRALIGELEVTKLSYYAYTKSTLMYQILNAGGALGKSCGPLLIAKSLDFDMSSSTKVAIPGENTTANLLLSLAYPQLTNKVVMLFSDIEAAVLEGRVDMGLIIHESRFTYEKKGLKKVADLGEYWENTTHSPIPLGAIVVKRSLDQSIKNRIDQLIQASVQYAFDHRDASQGFIKQHCQEMEDEVIAAHIGLYVNEYSRDLGPEGKAGVRTFFEVVKQQNKEGIFIEPFFVDE